VDAALAGRPLTIHGDGGQTRDFTFVGSVCAVIGDAVRRRVADAEPVNLAFGGRTSLNGLVGVLEDVVGHPVERVHVAPRGGDVRDSQADTQRLRRLFPGAEPVALRDGLQATVDWFRTLTPAPAG
jgi:UDP-glucose 4-epimerase